MTVLALIPRRAGGEAILPPAAGMGQGATPSDLIVAMLT